jgi:hypothetical protein
VRRDLNRYIVIKTPYGESSVKSYPSALKGDAKIGSRLWKEVGVCGVVFYTNYDRKESFVHGALARPPTHIYFFT